MTTPEETTEEAPKPTSIDEQEARFAEIERTIAQIRAFIEKHRDAFLQCKFSSWGLDGDIKISLDYNEDKALVRQQAVSVAKLFGSDGWARIPDSFSCGKINWVKKLDDITLIIDGAESVKPLLSEVKLP